MTIEEIANELGLSKSTVSRALSGKGRISADTVNRVQAYVKAYAGFLNQPKKENPNIGVVIPADAVTVTMPFFQECLMGVYETASVRGYDVIIVKGGESDISQVQRLVETKKVEGMILTRSVEDDRLIKYLTDMKFPVALSGTCENEDVIQVDSDTRLGADRITSMLIAQGYDRFAVVVGDTNYRVNKNRLNGVLDSIKRNGLDESKQLVQTGFTNMELVDSVVRDIIKADVSCVVCGDDMICTRLMSKLQAEGIRIPSDMGVISLYNSVALECFTPAVTAMEISARTAGNVLAKELIDKIEGMEYHASVLQSYDILFRKSTEYIVR